MLYIVIMYTVYTRRAKPAIAKVENIPIGCQVRVRLLFFSAPIRITEIHFEHVLVRRPKGVTILSSSQYTYNDTRAKLALSPDRIHRDLTFLGFRDGVIIYSNVCRRRRIYTIF